MKVQDNVLFVKGQDEFIPDANVYVIGDPSSRDLSLVDAGLTGKGEYKTRAVQDLGVELSHVRRIIMTHTHFDHIGCLREILNMLPEAELWVHANEAEPLERGDERTVYGMEMLQSMCQSQFGMEPGAFSFKVDRKLQGGEILEIGGMSWQVLHVPGHSAGSIALYQSEDRILIPGDVIYADYAIGRFDLHLANGRELKGSLESLAELDVKKLLPGHNRIVTDLEKGYIRKTVKQWEPFLV